MYQIDDTERSENLSIYMSQDYVKSDVRLILDKVNEINENRWLGGNIIGYYWL